MKSFISFIIVYFLLLTAIAVTSQQTSTRKATVGRTTAQTSNPLSQ